MERPTFSKHERLTGRLRIAEVVEQGRSIQDPPIRLVGRAMELPTTARAQVAFAIPKRYMKLAVDRNRMRRLMREAYRLDKAQVLDRAQKADRQYAWLFIYQSRNLLSLAETRERLSRLLDRWMEKHG
ncbi:MAG: ribonuclease P protein component [Flavobacteriales bacterium]|nr:ribonuclease P protein component [Flavobacteriales bacterium]